MVYMMQINQFFNFISRHPKINDFVLFIFYTDHRQAIHEKTIELNKKSFIIHLGERELNVTDLTVINLHCVNFSDR